MREHLQYYRIDYLPILANLEKRSDSLELQVYKYEYPYFRECQLQLHTVITSTAQNDVNLADFVKVDVDNDNGNPPS